MRADGAASPCPPFRRAWSTPTWWTSSALNRSAAAPRRGYSAVANQRGT